MKELRDRGNRTLTKDKLMGSWYGTCAISKTSIIDGDRVVVVPMVRDPTPVGRTDEDGGWVCGIQVDWRPFHVPLRGAYDGYGAAELDAAPDADSFHSYFAGDPMKSEVFRFNGREFDLQFFKNSCVDDVLKSIDRGYVHALQTVVVCEHPRDENGFTDFNVHNESVYCPMGFLLVHEAIWDALAARHRKEVARRVDASIGRDPNARMIELMTATFEKTLRAENDPDADAKLAAHTEKMEALREMGREDGLKSAVESEGERWATIVPVTREHLEAAVTLNEILYATRTLLHPQAGGTSDNNEAEFKAVHKAHKTVLAARKARWEE